MAIIDLHEQNKSYSCGAACLRNALLILGTRKKERAVRHAARTNHKGTSEASLRQAAERFGYRLEENAVFEKEKGIQAYRWLVRELKQSRPVILCVDDFTHWVLAIGIIERRIALADPAVHDQTKHFGLYTRGGLLKRWWIDDPEKVEQSQYYGMSVVPDSKLAKSRAKRALKLTEGILRTLQRDDDTDIHEAARDLYRIFTAAGTGRANGCERLSTGDVMSRYEEDILAAVGRWHSESDIKLLKPVYQTYKDVAAALEYTIPEKHVSRVVAELTALISGLIEKS
jgi:hypothetical protein